MRTARSDAAQHYYFVGCWEQAVAEFRKTLDLNLDLSHVHQLLGLVYLGAGRLLEALAEVIQERNSVWRLQGQVLVCDALGKTKESEVALGEFMNKYQDAAPCQIAEVFACRGKNDQAFQWLERTYAGRDGGLALVKDGPLLKNLHGDNRFSRLLGRLRLLL